jgi:hypothetical protein
MAAIRAVTIHAGHVFSDFMAYAPRGLVGHTKLALKLFRGDALPRSGKQIHGVKPHLEGRPGFLKRCPRHRVNMMPAPRTLIGREFLNPGKSSVFATFGAFKPKPVAHRHQMLKAGIVVGETPEKVMDCKSIFSHF